MIKNQKHTICLLIKFKIKLRKNFISTMTNTRFKIPADTKSAAEIKWLELSVIFDSTIDDILKTTDWRNKL